MNCKDKDVGAVATRIGFAGGHEFLWAIDISESD
jgi:hypothetical protein